MNKKTALLGLLSVLSLAGCVDTTDVAPEQTFPPTAADMASPAYQACRTAIAQKIGGSVDDVAIYDYLYSEANTQIMATVAGGEAPWRCLSSNSGVVAEVMYTGSEGSL